MLNGDLTQNTLPSTKTNAMNIPTIPAFSEAEVATILAALRYLQSNREEVEDLELSHFEAIECLTNEEIDELCESINFGLKGV